MGKSTKGARELGAWVLVILWCCVGHVKNVVLPVIAFPIVYPLEFLLVGFAMLVVTWVKMSFVAVGLDG